MQTLLGATRDRFLLALQYQDYRNLWIATTCSASAAWALIIVRGWLAYEITGGALWVGIVTFAAMFPRVISTPLAGFLADKFDRKTLIQWVYALNFAHNVFLSILVMNGLASPWILMFLALFNGTLRSSQMTFSTALVPNLVPKEYLLNAIALNQATQQGARMVGALAILPLVALVNLDTAFWLCSGFYLIAFVQTRRVTTQSTGVMDSRNSFFRNLFQGFGYVYGRPTILAMVLLVLAHCALTMSYESILPSLSQEKLGQGSIGITYLIGGVGAGALASSIFMAGVRSNVTRGKLFLIFGFASGIGPILLAVSSDSTLSVLCAVFMGMNQAGFMTITHTIIQSMVDDSVRGRVAGVYSVHVGGSMAVTNMVNAAFTDIFGASPVLIVGGLAFTFAMFLGLSSPPLRQLFFFRADPTSPTEANTEASRSNA